MEEEGTSIEPLHNDDWDELTNTGPNGMLSKGVRILTVETDAIANPIDFTKDLLPDELWEMVDVAAHSNQIVSDRWGAITLIAKSRKAAINIVSSFKGKAIGDRVSRAVLLLPQVEGKVTQRTNTRAPLYQPAAPVNNEDV